MPGILEVRFLQSGRSISTWEILSKTKQNFIAFFAVFPICSYPSESCHGSGPGLRRRRSAGTWHKVGRLPKTSRKHPTERPDTPQNTIPIDPSPDPPGVPQTCLFTYPFPTDYFAVTQFRILQRRTFIRPTAIAREPEDRNRLRAYQVTLLRTSEVKSINLEPAIRRQ